MIKKMISIIALIIVAGALTAFIVPAFGLAECDANVYVSNNTAANLTFEDCSVWAISNNNFVIGKKSPTETVPMLMAQSPEYKIVRGCVETGLIREKAMMKAVVNGSVCGFTQLNATVVIKREFIDVVENIVLNKLNEEGLCANKIIACTMWWEGDYVSHIFFTSETDKTAVGYVVFNGGKDTAIIYMGDFDKDGSLELGFTAGWNTETPKPEPTPSPNAPSQPTKKNCCKKGCVFQINILSIVNNCFKNLCK